MATPLRAAGLLIATVLASCGPTSSPPAGTPQEQQRVRDPRLREDVGGFQPTSDLLDEAAALATLASKAERIARLDAMPPARRVDVLRAGLRLADDAAARLCAARLTYKQIDRWECARCVDLLIGDVLRSTSEADFDEFRSYLGSVELTRFLRALPPLPWDYEPGLAIAQTHRVARVEHLPVFEELTAHADPRVAEVADENAGLLLRWNDEPDVVPTSDAGGFTPAFAASLREEYLTRRYDEKRAYRIDVGPDERLWNSTPGPRDVELLIELTEYGENASWQQIDGVAYLLLGKLRDPKSEEFLRTKAADGLGAAQRALVRRGDPKLVEQLAAEWQLEDKFALALLMEADPARARRFIETTLLGPDDEAAAEMLDELEEFVPPGAYFVPLGYDWRRTSFEGFDKAALASAVPARRLARIALVMPGCRTRAFAEAVAARLRPGDLDPEDQLDAESSELEQVAAFLEVGAPDALRAALRRIAAADAGDEERAVRWLVRLGDKDAAAAFVAAGYEFGWLHCATLAETRAPQVRTFFESILRDWLQSGPADEPPGQETVALAVFHGLPETAANGAFETLSRATVETVLAGRPLDALTAVLAAAPDAWHGNVGAVDDPRVRAYLARLRERRELGLYWDATAQLAAMGDPAARAEFWGAMQDGRYRIMNEANFFERTLGGRFDETMPFWIDELRSQCCRIVTNGLGDIVEKTIGIDGYDSAWRTPYRRVMEIWDSCGGRFVRSRIAGHWVPEPR